jgi:hypothetical protein
VARRWKAESAAAARFCRMSASTPSHSHHPSNASRLAVDPDSVESGFCTGNPGQADGVLAGHIAAVVDVTGGGTCRGEPMPELAPVTSALAGEVVRRGSWLFPYLGWKSCFLHAWLRGQSARGLIRTVAAGAFEPIMWDRYGSAAYFRSTAPAQRGRASPSRGLAQRDAGFSETWPPPARAGSPEVASSSAYGSPRCGWRVRREWARDYSVNCSDDVSGVRRQRLDALRRHQWDRRIELRAGARHHVRSR